MLKIIDKAIENYNKASPHEKQKYKNAFSFLGMMLLFFAYELFHGRFGAMLFFVVVFTVLLVIGSVGLKFTKPRKQDKKPLLSEDALVYIMSAVLMAIFFGFAWFVTTHWGK